MSIDTIHEEPCRHRRKTASIWIPIIVICCCLVTILHQSPEVFQLLIKRRTLLTLSPEHVSQYPFENLLEVDEEQPTNQKKVVGFYWQIPRCGGTTLKHVLGTCLHRVQAARTSADYCDMNTLSLQRCRTKVGTFVNADPSDHGGIQRCQKMGLVPSGATDIIVSSRILHAATLFDDFNKGRVFTVFRDPIERAVSTFYYLQNAYWERHYRPELKDMTLLDYAELPDTANNWMTRWLTGKNAEPHLSREDLEFAKELVRRKFLVMLTDEMASSVQRLMYYMEWDIPDEHWNETKACLMANTQKESGQNRNKHLMPEKDSPAYEALKSINDLDIELFEYAKKLFQEQWTDIFEDKRNNRIDELFNNEDSTQLNVTNVDESIIKANIDSEHAAAVAAAALMERPPDEASMQSIEHTNNLVESALLLNKEKLDTNETDDSDSPREQEEEISMRNGVGFHNVLGVTEKLESEVPAATTPSTEDTREALGKTQQTEFIRRGDIQASSSSGQSNTDRQGIISSDHDGLPSTIRYQQQGTPPMWETPLKSRRIDPTSNEQDVASSQNLR